MKILYHDYYRNKLPFKYTVNQRSSCSYVHIFITAPFIKYFVENKFMLKNRTLLFVNGNMTKHI